MAKLFFRAWVSMFASGGQLAAGFVLGLVSGNGELARLARLIGGR